MQLGRAPLVACRPLARLGRSASRTCVRATGSSPGSSKTSRNSLLDFFNDITEGARDGPRMRSVQERDVRDDTDTDNASKAYQAADAAAAAKLQAKEAKPQTTQAADTAKGGLARPAAASRTEAGTDKQSPGTSAGAAVAGASAATGVTDAAASALQETAAAAAVIAEKGLSLAKEAAAPGFEALAVALDAQVTSLRAKAGQLQLQAASGQTSTNEAIKALLGQFSDAISALEDTAAAGTASRAPPAAGSAKLQAALQRCRKDAVTGARMVEEAAARQDISSVRAVQYLSSLLRQLAADASAEITQQGKQQQKLAAAAEITQQGKQQQKPAAAAGAGAASRAAAAVSAPATAGKAPASASSVAADQFGGAAGTAAVADGLQDNQIVVASVDELELVLQGASSQSRVVRAAAKGFAAAEATAESLQQRLPQFKQALRTAAPTGSTAAERQAAARVLIGAAGEVEGQLAELQSELVAQFGGGEAGAAAAASLQLLRDNVEARVQKLAGQVETGQRKPAAALDELLKGLQTSMSGELRSCLLDSLSLPSAPGSASASVSMSDEEVAAQLASAIHAARREQAAKRALAKAAAARQLDWMLTAAVGVGLLQLVKVAFGMAFERVGIALPGALGGMLAVAAVLMSFSEAKVEPVVQMYDSYVGWTASMLPLFYVPTLAVVPALLQGTDVALLLQSCAGGAAGSLVFAAILASWLGPKAAAPDTPQATNASSANSSSEKTALLAATAFAAVAPLVLTKFDPAAFGQLMTAPVGLAWSMLGFLAAQRTGVNPMLLGAAAANVGVFWHGKLMGWDFAAAMHAFFGQGAGAGELLTAMLGVALTGLGFVIYKQRRSISLPAVAVTAVVTAVWNLVLAVGDGATTLLPDVWSKALVARGVATSLATDVARSMGASPECTAIAVLLQTAAAVVLGGSVRVLLSHSLLQRLPGDKEAAAGIAAGCTAGGIGAASISAGKPVALANGLLAYVAVHLLSAAVLGNPGFGEALREMAAMDGTARAVAVAAA